MQQIVEMRKLLLKSDITNETLDSIQNELSGLSEELKKIASDELDKVFNTTYARAYKAYTPHHITEEMWNNYDLLGVRNLPEQVTLRKALKKLNVHFLRLMRRFCHDTFKDTSNDSDATQEAGSGTQDHNRDAEP